VDLKFERPASDVDQRMMTSMISCIG